jgi:hypothetical protein
MSWAFITALKKNPQQSYVQLLNSIRDELQTRYTQKPQLSCSHPLGKLPLFPLILPRPASSPRKRKEFQNNVRCVADLFVSWAAFMGEQIPICCL